MHETQTEQLAVILYLSKLLEEELDKKNIEGISLSDKLKSFDIYLDEDAYANTEEYKKKRREIENEIYMLDEEDEYEINRLEKQLENFKGYAYREYKRNLIGGLYNDLRWAAHERNQMMHQDSYLVDNFKKYTRTMISGIKYFNPQFSFNTELLLISNENSIERFFFNAIDKYLDFNLCSLFKFMQEKIDNYSLPLVIITFILYLTVLSIIFGISIDDIQHYFSTDNLIATIIRIGIVIFVSYVIYNLFIMLILLTSLLLEKISTIFCNHNILLLAILSTVTLWNTKFSDLSNLF